MIKRFSKDTAMPPPIIITDKNGKILFADLTDNYRVRPEPSGIGWKNLGIHSNKQHHSLN